MPAVKWLLLGTGANEGVPAFRCLCRHCREARARGGHLIRQNSCALVSEGGFHILIDMPPQISSQLAAHRFDETKLSALLFTHRHEDHTLGARSLRGAASEKGFILPPPIPLITEASVFAEISRQRRLEEHTESFVFTKILPYHPLSLGPFTVTAVETGHLKTKGTEETSLGYILENQAGKRAAYLVDAPGRLPGETKDFLIRNPPDLMILDGTFASAPAGSAHGDLASALEMRKGFPDIPLILTHIGHGNLLENELIEKLSPYGITPGWDGMEIDL